jgi:ATP-dependent Lon protease
VDIPEKYRKKLNFVPVKNFKEVLAVALVDWEPNTKKNKVKVTKPNRRAAA